MNRKLKFYKYFKIAALILISFLIILSIISLILSFNLNWFNDPKIAERFVIVWNATESILVSVSLPISTLYYLNMLNGIIRSQLEKDIDKSKMKNKIKNEIKKDIIIKNKEKNNQIEEEYKLKNIHNWVQVKKNLNSYQIILSEKEYVLIFKEISKKNIDFNLIKKIIFDFAGKNVSIINLEKMFITKK